MELKCNFFNCVFLLSNRSNFSSRRINKIDDVFNNKRCTNWFKEYTTPDDPETLGPEGMERFCVDIGVDPEDVVMLGECLV